MEPKIFIFDQLSTADNLAIFLSMRGYEVITNDDRRQAFRQIVTFRPQLVLAEYLDVDGEWLCANLRNIPALNEILIIMMSHKGAQVDLKKFEAMILSFGANGYLLKPFEPRDLPEQIESWLQE